MDAGEARTGGGAEVTGRVRRAAVRFAPRMRTVHLLALALAALLAVGTIVTLRAVISTQDRASRAAATYQVCREAVEDLSEASDLLTDEARAFVTTGERAHLDIYVQELTVTDRRGAALQTLRERGGDGQALEELAAARERSDELAEVELYAMRLVAEAVGMGELPERLDGVELAETDRALEPTAMRRRAYGLVFGADYDSLKLDIRESVQASSAVLLEGLQADIAALALELDGLVVRMKVMVAALLVLFVVTSASTQLLLLVPLTMFARSIRDDRPLDPVGTQELRGVVAVYNEMYARTHAVTDMLDFEAHNDALTGLLNRGSFDSLLYEHGKTSALLLVDVDDFKGFNDTWGHEMGDAILVEVSATLFSVFRVSDFICRVGGDEFAVIMTDADAGLRDVIADKLERAAAFLASEENGLPPASVSVGVAFGARDVSGQELTRRADAALYEAKRRGRNGFVFYDEM